MKIIIKNLFFVLIFLFVGCGAKNKKIIQIEQNYKTNVVKNNIDRFGVDMIDRTSVDINKVSNNEFSTIYFDFDKFSIRADMRENLSKNAQLLKNNLINANIVLEGNCDEIGTKLYNYNLGLKRAKQVSKELQLLGIKSNRISIISHGKENLVCKNKAQNCNFKNRRVDINIIK